MPHTRHRLNLRPSGRRARQNRWLIPSAALAVHLRIGQAYATSVCKTALVAHFDAGLTAVGGG